LHLKNVIAKQTHKKAAPAAAFNTVTGAALLPESGCVKNLKKP